MEMTNMDLNKEIMELAKEYESYIIRCRRAVHTFAEVAMHEDKTHRFILEEAKKLGLSYEEVPTTSVIVKLDTGRPGKTVALRADIDALPMKEDENNLVGRRTCRSQQPNTCHACGHDGHTAMLLGAMQILTRMKDQLNGVVLFCFEEGEEPNTGVAALLEALEKYHVDICWGTHLYADLEEGKISVEAGPRMAGFTDTDVTFIGKGGHGSRPDLAVNPVFCGAAFLTNLSTAFANQITAGETVTMGITRFCAGETHNIIPTEAELTGTFRFFNAEEGKKAKEIMRKVAKDTADMFRCQVEFNRHINYWGGPVVNDQECASVAAQVLEEMLPAGTVVTCPPWYAGECFSLWLERYPGVFAFLGIKNEEGGYGAPHHDGRFDFNEKILATGAASAARYAAAWLV